MFIPVQAIRRAGQKDRSRVHYQTFHNIFLYVTERCQLRCGHCYMGDRLERGLSLTKEAAFKIISNCRKIGAEYITFLGGEPTLHPDLPQMVNRALELGYSQVTIDSNGLNPLGILAIPPGHLHYVSISLDGATPTSHEAVRGNGTFRKTRETIETLISRGYSIRINCTVFRFNLPEAGSLLDYADRVGISLVNFHSFSEEGYGAVRPEWALEKPDWVSFCDWLDSARDRYKTAVWYPPTWTRPEKMEHYVRDGFRGCLGTSLDRLSIFPDRRCYVCSVMFDHAMHFATMTDDGLVLNRGANEFDLFSAASFGAETASGTGCPAEAFLGGSEKREEDQHLVSMCRCWKSQG
jgi:pyruvate-formate lyase-activating enzyme